ncbi:MAG: glycosyltransferase family 2 protein [Bacteroidaceae bacterium]|nr:glycosyltransferase family 2 protein [Bacteroidaceae bacterium]
MISVLLAVYNTSLYLTQCLRSILDQSYKDLEVIVVNDASTDDSLTICRNFEKKDKRVKVVNLVVNVGLEKVRRVGLKEATGDYVMFVDSDDWLHGKDTIKAMYEKIEETGADYVEVMSQRVMDKWGLIKTKSSCPVYGLIKQPELFNDYYISFFGKNVLSVNIWGKLYRRSTFAKADLEPIGLTMGEDLSFNVRLFPHLQSVYIMDRIGYNYRFGGMTSRYNPNLLPDLKKLFVIKDRLRQEQHYDTAYDYLRIELKNVFRSDICQRIIFDFGDKQDILFKIKEELRDPLYQEIQKVRNTPGFLDDSFVKAMAEQDAESIYNQCQTIVKQQRWQRLKKKIVSFLLGFF